MKKNKFLALTVLCSLFAVTSANTFGMKDSKSYTSERYFGPDDGNNNKNVKAIEDSKFLEYISEVLLATGVICGTHEWLSCRFGQKGQFYEDIAYGSLVGIYRRRAEAKAKAVGLSVSKIKEIIKKPFFYNLEEYRDFREVEVSLKSVPLKYKQQILNFWQSRKFDGVLVIPFSGKEVLDLLKKHCKDRLELINKYSEEIKNNVKLVVCAEFDSNDFDYDNHYGCLTFAVSKSGCINEINDILTNNGETFSISREKFLNLFECGFSSGQVSFNLCYKEGAKKKE